MHFKVAAFYRFTPLTDIAGLRQTLRAAFAPLDLCGSLLIAPEGVNATLAGSVSDIDQMLTIMHRHTQLDLDDVKFSSSAEKPFQRLKIRLKREIVTFQQPQADPSKRVGTYVEAKDWNLLLQDPDLLIIDTRNLYETGIGSFKGAIDPGIETFTEFASFVRTNLDPSKHKKIAMFCTGGIRCEKASSFMLHEGFPEVYHLKGGILKYLEDVPPCDSKWDGECYVFDRRISVGHGLVVGGLSMCFSCGRPLRDEDRAHSLYEEGVSCESCHATTDENDKARFRARQKQMTENNKVANGSIP